MPPPPQVPPHPATRPSCSLLASVKLQLRPVQLAENDAVGGWFGGGGGGGGGGVVTVTDFDVVPVAPLSSVTVSCTVYVPAGPYVWLGVCTVALPPSPKVQLH